VNAVPPRRAGAPPPRARRRRSRGRSERPARPSVGRNRGRRGRRRSAPRRRLPAAPPRASAFASSRSHACSRPAPGGPARPRDNADRRSAHLREARDLAALVLSLISRTAASWVPSSRRSVSGSPISLFWLPAVLSVRSRDPRTVATASFTEVFPTLPVIPTVNGSKRDAAGGERLERDEGIRDEDDGRRSGRRDPRARPSRDFVTTTAAAPRRRTLEERDRRAVAASAKKTQPGDTMRESTAPPRSAGRRGRGSSCRWRRRCRRA
jgi:hypothetical protein